MNTEVGKYIVFNTISENQFSSVLVGRDRNNEDREFILKKMRTSGLTEEEKRFLLNCLLENEMLYLN